MFHLQLSKFIKTLTEPNRTEFFGNLSRTRLHKYNGNEHLHCIGLKISESTIVRVFKRSRSQWWIMPKRSAHLCPVNFATLSKSSRTEDFKLFPSLPKSFPNYCDFSMSYLSNNSSVSSRRWKNNPFPNPNASSIGGTHTSSALHI